MNRKPVAFLAAAGIAALCESAALHAQETPAAVKDPISAADCLKDKKKAPDCQRLDRACGEGVVAAYDVLGRAHAGGIGVARDVPKAAKLLDSACAASQPLACFTLGQLLDTGNGIPRDAERARALMGKACSLGSTEACERACDWGDGNFCQRLGRQLERAKEPDAGRIDRAYDRACNAALAESCYYLGLRTKDSGLALALFERACSLEDPFGCLAVAQYYQVGREVAIDLDRAVRLYERACDKEVSVACRDLGGLYARGDLGAENVAKGQVYLVKGCGDDVECRAIIANGRIPSAWGSGLEALRPPATATAIEGCALAGEETVEGVAAAPGGGAPSAGRGSFGPPRRRDPVTCRVGGSIKEPKKIQNVNPIYPPMARAALLQGAVALECVISPRGEVKDVRVVQSNPMFDAAAVDSVCRWRYTPALLDGRPVPVIMTVTVTFSIN